MFDNKERDRYYGIRIGDMVKECFNKQIIFEGEVIRYGLMDNNAVIVRNQESGVETECVAEWCEIIQKVDEWIPSPNHCDAIITRDEISPIGMLDDSYEYYGGHLIAESVPPKYANLISAAPELLEALLKVLPHAMTIINTNHADYKLAMAAIKKATKS